MTGVPIPWLSGTEMSWVHAAEVVLIFGCLLLLAFAPKIERSRVIPAGIGIVVAVAAVVIGLQETGLSRLGLVVTGASLVVGMCLLSSAELFERRQTPEAAALLLIGGIGAIVLVDGKNLLELALGVEMISLAGAALVSLGQGQRPLEAGFKYFVLTAVTFATLLFGMALCFLATGSLDVPALGAVEAGLRPFAVVGVGLFAIGLCFKLAVVPVHFGALDAYTAGPSSFVGFIMVVSKLGAAIGLARLVSGAGEVLAVPLLGVGLVTISVAVIASFAQSDLRRLMAYSAIAHAGFLAVGVASGTTPSQTVGFYVVGYGAAALLAFACLAGTGTGPLPLSALKPGGSVQLGPARAIGLIVALLSLAGVPPFPGFWTKLAILQASWTSWGVAATSIAALGGVLGIVYYLRPLPDLFTQASETRSQSTFGALASTGVLLVVVIVLAVAPGIAWTLAGR
ncbi:MAG: proton-conducting transporter membrane subunit [Deltaproteobacteria bacterium]|nr:proton-conducting transporter membrane subunit [Deltaproteobacteria bacterium]